MVYTINNILYYDVETLVAAVAIYLNETCKLNFTIIPTPPTPPKVFGKCVTANICATCAVHSSNKIVYIELLFRVPVILISKNTLYYYYTPIRIVCYTRGKKFAARNRPVPLNSSRALNNSLFFFWRQIFLGFFPLFLLFNCPYSIYELFSPASPRSVKGFFSLVYFNPQRRLYTYVKFITIIFPLLLLYVMLFKLIMFVNI